MNLVGVQSIPEDVQAHYRAEGLWGGVRLRDGVEAHARRAPDHLAVVDATTRWSYARLEEAVTRSVGFLVDRGVGPGTAVVVVAPVAAPSVIAYQAVIRAGALALMLDRRCGRADVVNALAATEVALILAPRELAEILGLAGLGVDIAFFDDLLEWPAAHSGWAEPDAQGPAAVVFTSGTTSRPKAVVHSLDTLRAGARNMAEALVLTAADVAFLSTPIASITGLVQMHLTLERGACLVLEDRFDPTASLERLRVHGVTVLGGAPVIVEELFKEALAQDLRELPLRAISLGGSMIPRSALELGVTRYGIQPVRVYGSSEVPVATATHPSDTGEARLTDDGACARGTEVRVLDEGASEILVRGPMRMLGYLDQADNDEAFTAGGWYRTGDLGRLEGGRLTVTGRLKEIVSRKGLKISLSEIDEVARGLPDIDESAAYGVPDPVTGERLALAVRAARVPEDITFEAVVGWLLDAGLAKWKLPEQVVVWDSPLPRTASGKIQRRMLETGTTAARNLLAPRLRTTEQ